jgi:hypothetical protein
MKPIREVYPDAGEDGYFSVGDYNPLLESLGYKIILQVDDNDYQGDSRLLLKDGDRYGWLQFGWGSCSGCDALQSCNNYEEVDKLRTGLANGIKWFDSKAEALEFFRAHDWEGDYSWNTSTQADFVSKSISLLS